MPLILGANDLVYRLPRVFLRAGSDSVWVGDESWRRGIDYVLDALRGELRLLRPPVPGDTLVVRACWLFVPPPLELQLNRYRLAPGEVAETLDTAAAGRPGRRPATARPLAARDPRSTPPGASLALSGNKTIAVDFGSNQDAFLRQSLDLTVSGSLAPGVEVTGVLSDRNTPLTAGGSTQSLEALDRVLIELQAPHGSAALGDVGLDLRQGEFARLERRLQGMRGDWFAGGWHGSVAAASAPGEFHRLQFFGREGRQGPYPLTDRDGVLGISVVAGSEVVTVDGARMTRGESADYSIDYERAQILFSNRRPVSSASRITVDYQYTANRYRRNLLTAGGRWEQGGVHAFMHALSEGDDRGRPLDLTLSGADRSALEAAGDSATFAVGGGVATGGGDYDTVRVDSARVVFSFAGPGAGEFAVEFARVGEGRGDYADSSLVDGRAAFRYVGAGLGAFQVGRSLPLPESHRLWTLGGGVSLGALSIELEGAVSELDHNLFSSRDDGDNRGEAGRLAMRLEGEAPGGIGGKAGLLVRGRAVSERFASFHPLEPPFAGDDWGVPLDAALDRQRRIDVTAYLRPQAGGELRASFGRLALPGGFTSLRRSLAWIRDGRLSTRAQIERAEGEDPRRRFADGGRARLRADVRWRLGWIEPALFGESDQRRFPSDSGRVGDRFRETGLELGSGSAWAWNMKAGYAHRRDARATAVGFVDQTEARTWRLAVDSPAEKRLGIGLVFQRRDLEPLAADPRRTRSDLGSLRLRGEDEARGLSSQVNLEVTSEGENRRVRELRFVGPGQGAYDRFGNFVGTGDYDLVVTVSPELDRIARAATSARVAWRFGDSEIWRGSRLGFDFEGEARRRGELKGGDALLAPAVVAGDGDLQHGSVLQRLEADLAPGSRASAVRLRWERRVSADRSFSNFAQILDDRAWSARWRTRPSPAWTGELEFRLRRQTAEQALVDAGGFRRVLLENAGSGQLVFTPDGRLRAAATAELSLSRPESQDMSTRTLRLGPDLGLAMGPRGRVEFTLRRALASGPAAVGLLPAADPAGPPPWEGSARLDYRVRDSSTLALSLTGRDRSGRKAQWTGRAELRAFF